MSIFLLTSNDNYEGITCLLKAYANKADADDICNAANEHMEKQPKAEMQMSDEDIETWDIEYQAWRAANPAGSEHFPGDFYAVHEIEFVGG